LNLVLALWANKNSASFSIGSANTRATGRAKEVDGHGRISHQCIESNGMLVLRNSRVKKISWDVIYFFRNEKEAQILFAG